MDATNKATAKAALINQLIADHRKRIAVTLQAVRDAGTTLPEFFEHVSDEFELKEYDDQGEEIDTHLDPDKILEAQVGSYLASQGRFTSRRFTLVKTNLPRELKLAGDGPDYVLTCRMVWMEAWVEAMHPAIDEIWDDVAACLRSATEAAGGRALLSPGKPVEAWRTFCKAFYPCMVEKTDCSARDFRLRLHIEQNKGPWFVFEE